MANLRGYVFGTCKVCHDDLYLNPENNMCILCELDWLREQLAQKDLCLSQSRREKAEALHKLSDERIKTFEGAE